MRVLDMNGFEIFDHNPMEVHLVPEKLLIKHHPAQEYVEEQGHYEVITEYANGGKDVKWVVDVPGKEPCDAWDEFEDILRATPYTDKEKAQNEIERLKQQLAETDYNIIKIAEGATTIEEKAEIIKQRAEWRQRINELEVLYGI